jgi:hypothetical protein
MKVYATDERQERFLRYVECDASGCEARAEPGSDELLRGGWVKCGVIGGRYPRAYDFCPDHAYKAGCLESGASP